MPNLLNDKSNTTENKKSLYSEICDEFSDVFIEPDMLLNRQIKHKIS